MYNRFSAFTRDAWISVGLAFVLGLVIGWLLLGWVLFPVSYTSTTPSDLTQGYRAQWIQMAADSFSVNHDLNLARDRLRWFTPAQVQSVLREQFDAYNKANRPQDAARLNDFARAYGVSLTGPAVPTPLPSTGPATAPGSLVSSLLPLLLGLLLLILVVAAILLIYSRLRLQGMLQSVGARPVTSPRYEEPPMAAPMSAAPPSAAPRAAPAPAPAAPPRAAAPARQAAAPITKSLGTFAATYKFGDDNYDTAFTLETARGEFLGECGMGISDTIGEGKPDKVTAFDLWLFDKIDVRTVTQILMSEYAFNDQALRQRLAQKGELTLAEKGKHILLETGTLRVDATIVDLVYASTPGLPPNSHFQKLIVQMEPVQK